MNDRPSVSWLFVPGDRADRFEKAAAAGADEIIIDLEDAVAPDAKEEARRRAVHFLSDEGSGWVRINALGTPWYNDDLQSLPSCPGLNGIMIPKAEAAAQLAQLSARLTNRPAGARQLVPLIETARGLRNLDTICSTPGVARLAFGSIDFALDIDARETDEALLYARSELVIASAAAGLPSPLDGVTTDFRNNQLLHDAAYRSRALGFGGKLCIHPAQVPVVNTAFAPTPEELDWAHRVLAAADADGSGAFTVDGRMIDRPLLRRAQRLLARARSQ